MTRRFDNSFSARSTHVQPIANSDWFDKLENGDKLLTSVSTGIGISKKLLGTFAIVVGTAMILSGEPFTGLKVFGEGLYTFLAGNAIRSAATTYGQSIANGQDGAKESGTQIVKRLGDNFKSGLLRPW